MKNPFFSHIRHIIGNLLKFRCKIHKKQAELVQNYANNTKKWFLRKTYLIFKKVYYYCILKAIGETMKIRYKFCDDKTSEIEVDEVLYNLYNQMEKDENRINRKETRRHISLDMLLEREQEGIYGCLNNKKSGDIEYRLASSNSDPLEILLQKEENGSKPKTKSLQELGLTEYQLKIATEYFVYKKPQSQIAREIGITHQVVNKHIAKIRKKMKNVTQKY